MSRTRPATTKSAAAIRSRMAWPSPLHVSHPPPQLTRVCLADVRASDLHHRETLSVQPSTGEEDQPLPNLRRSRQLHGDVPAGEVVQRPRGTQDLLDRDTRGVLGNGYAGHGGRAQLSNHADKDVRRWLAGRAGPAGQEVFQVLIHRPLQKRLLEG